MEYIVNIPEIKLKFPVTSFSKKLVELISKTYLRLEF